MYVVKKSKKQKAYRKDENMGLFSKSELCSICSSNNSNKKLSDGCICKECIRKCDLFIKPLSWKYVSAEKVRNAIHAQEANNDLLKIFSSSKTVGGHLTVDETNQLWKLDFLNVIFSYNDIIDFELLEDGESITKGGLGSAIVGGALFGGVGAVVGGTIGKKKTKQEITELKIKIITKNTFYPDLYINFLTTGKVKSTSFSYKTCCKCAQDILSQLSIMTDSASNNNMALISPADEIMKYKKLLDDNIITKEEFEAKKKQLLKL